MRQGHVTAEGNPAYLVDNSIYLLLPDRRPDPDGESLDEHAAPPRREEMAQFMYKYGESEKEYQCKEIGGVTDYVSKHPIIFFLFAMPLAQESAPRNRL